jgi:hypothetical protein
MLASDGGSGEGMAATSGSSSAAGADPPVDPFDPVALEARLVEARARRALALAGRAAAKPDAGPVVAPAMPGPQEPPAAAPSEPPASRAGIAGRFRPFVLAVFLAGLGVGAAATMLANAPSRDAPEATQAVASLVAPVARQVAPSLPAASSGIAALPLPVLAPPSLRAPLTRLAELPPPRAIAGAPQRAGAARSPRPPGPAEALTSAATAISRSVSSALAPAGISVRPGPRGPVVRLVLPGSGKQLVFRGNGKNRGRRGRDD